MAAPAEGSIKAQLVSTMSCKAHWIITFSESAARINADLSGNNVRYSRNTLAQVLDTIEFRIHDDCPPIEEMRAYIWLPHHLTKELTLCRCVEWVWGVLRQYVRIGYINDISADGIPLGRLLETLVDRQSNALIEIEMRRLQAETDGMQRASYSRTEGDDGETAGSVKAVDRMQDQLEHHEEVTGEQ